MIAPGLLLELELNSWPLVNKKRLAFRFNVERDSEVDRTFIEGHTRVVFMKVLSTSESRSTLNLKASLFLFISGQEFNSSSNSRSTITQYTVQNI